MIKNKHRVQFFIFDEAAEDNKYYDHGFISSDSADSNDKLHTENPYKFIKNRIISSETDMETEGEGFSKEKSDGEEESANGSGLNITEIIDKIASSLEFEDSFHNLNGMMDISDELQTHKSGLGKCNKNTMESGDVKCDESTMESGDVKCDKNTGDIEMISDSEEKPKYLGTRKARRGKEIG